MAWAWWAAALLAGGLFLVWMYRVGARAGSPADVRARFAGQRPRLEEEFFRAAAGSGKPRGLRWVGCDWEPGEAFARDRATGQLVALVGVTLRFEAIPGGDMEDLPAVGNLRNASAVFFHQRGRWHTTGKAVFNLNPDEVVRHFRNLYEPVEG